MIKNPVDYTSSYIVDNNQSDGSKSFRGIKFGETVDFGMMDDDEEEDLGNDIVLTPFDMKSHSSKTREASSSSSSHSSFHSRKSKDLFGYTIKEGTGFEEYNPYKPKTPERAPGKHYKYDLNKNFKKENNECCIIL
uniref:Uncharacterized protein n=1 Tax=Meloidogyne javanica TaxID=6303 RepID=A0A915LNA7_MELJA